MMRSVASFTCSSGSTVTGSPTTAVWATPQRQCGLRPLNMMRCEPHSPTGVTATPRPRASRAVPDLPAIGSRSIEIVPSGNTATHSPAAERVDRGVERVDRVLRAALHRDLVRGAQQRAEPALVEQLGLGEEPQAPARGGRRRTRA